MFQPLVMKRQVSKTNSMINFPPLIVALWLKPMAIGVIGWLAGWLASVTVMAFQTPTPTQSAQSPWYESPAVIAAIMAAVVTVMLKVLDRKWTKNDQQETQHQTLSDRLAELTAKEREQLLGGLKGLHAQEIQFWKTQLQVEEISNFEARQRSHRFGNEVNRLHAHIHICHIEMAKGNLTIPEFTVKSYDELMNGLDEETEKFRQSIVKKLEEVIHPEAAT
jgi:hypothetical protein